jgi:hypothetical protein
MKIIDKKHEVMYASFSARQPSHVTILLVHELAYGLFRLVLLLLLLQKFGPGFSALLPGLRVVRGQLYGNRRT